jgi:hypothetical protein
MGMICEIRNLQKKALSHYQQSYFYLKEAKKLPQHYFEAKVFAGIINYKVLLMLYYYYIIIILLLYSIIIIILLLYSIILLIYYKLPQHYFEAKVFAGIINYKVLLMLYYYYIYYIL